ncbi:pilus assembly protein TadG-related protein [Pseudomonas abieticivorans]|uniref:pilus assembly protein TadG-related protein n=1 Tax=Pseudomonas abieticivorans TaxID=2931382 RepID=UPI0020C11227|nr:pilus assembly protein TadG-related protein [Pseudomonas sp. PIA16]
MVARFTVPRRQRGAIGLMAAGTLAVALLFMLLSVDSGRLYLEKRKLQGVADMSALAAANQSAVCTGSGTSALSVATNTAQLNNHVVGTDRTLAVACGTLVTGANAVRTFSASASSNQAIQVKVTHSVATSVAAGLWSLFNGAFSTTTNLQATAVAALPGPPLAQLSIQSTLANVDTTKSALLNPLFSGLLGSNVSLDAVSWNSLVNTNINLLSYMNQLAVNLGVSAGNYTELLGTQTSVTKLIQAAIDVMKTNSAAATVVTSLGALQVGSANSSLVTLGDILQLQNGTTSSGLDANLQLFQLAEAFVQLANGQSGATATIPVNVLGLANATTQLKIIEPAQFSAVGNPNGPAQIYVQTAQAKVLISVTLPAVQTAIDGLNALISPLITGINLALKALTCPLGIGSCMSADLALLPSAAIDIGIKAASADSYVTGYTCSGTTKSLTATGETSAATFMVGQIDPNNFFSSTQVTVVNPVLLLDIGMKACPTCARVSTAGGGLGITANSNLLAKAAISHTYVSPPNVGQSPSQVYTYNSPSNAVQSLATTLSGITIKSYPVQNASLVGLILNVVTGLIATTFNLLTAIISTILSPLVDPILNNLLSLLGINLSSFDVGANLTCQTGRAALVI